MIPGSVHWVRFRKRVVTAIAPKKRRGMAGLIYQMGWNMKME